jgi:eukaryotic-like serine/threonine-protein kinase
MMHTVACLDDATVLELVAGRLDPAALARADDHLDACEDCRALVLGLHRADRWTAGQSSPSTPAVGTKLGRFVVLEPVGAGAMGVVYSAYDPELDRRVALKLIRADAGATTNAARTRLLGEAQAMAKLSHPNVVAIYDVGTAGDAVFLAMELVEGVTLRAWCEARRRSWRELRDVCVQAGRGLAAAHAVGLVHRDYKPDNVIVDAVRARVGDFGLATARRAEPTLPSVVAASGALGESTMQSSGQSSAWVGTPAYMSPEQLAGARPDARSDQYAFCVASYELLCGTHPFAAPTFAALVERIERGRIAPPADREVPRWLVAVLTRGLQRRPDDRFPDMDALLVAMQRDLRRRAGVRAAGVALLVAAASTGAYVVGARTEPITLPCGGAAEALAVAWGPERAAEVEAAFVQVRPRYGAAVAQRVLGSIDTWSAGWEGMHEDACQATRVRGEQSEALLDLRMACLQGQRRELAALVDRFAAADPTVVDHAEQAAVALPDVEACADVDALGAVVAPPGDPALATEVEAIREAAAEVWARLRTGQHELAVTEAQVLLRRAMDTGYGPVIAELQLAVAHAVRLRGELPPARAAALESLWAAQAAGHDRVVAEAWMVLLEIEGTAGRYPSAVELGRHTSAAVARLGSPPSLEAPLRNAMGVVLDNLGHYDEAEISLQRALELRRVQLGEDSPEVARVLTNLGNLARNRRAYADALALHRAALAIDQRALGDEHPVIGQHLHNIARLLLLTGAHDEALASYQRALAAKLAAFGPMHVEVARTYNSLGLLYAAAGDAERAMAEYERALAIYEAHAHPERGIVRYNLGLQRAAAGDHEGALRSYAEARPILEQGFGTSSRYYAELVLATADAQLALDEPAVARAGYLEAQPLKAAPAPAPAPEPAPAKPSPAEPEPRALPGAYAPGPGWDEPSTSTAGERRRKKVAPARRRPR